MRNLARAPRLTVGASYHTNIPPGQISSSFFWRKSDPGVFHCLEAGSGRTCRARQRAGRALRAGRLAVQQAVLPEVARAEQTRHLVQVVPGTRVGAGRSAGVARAALAVAGAVLRQVARAHEGAGHREVRVTLVADTVVVVVALVAREGRPRTAPGSVRADAIQCNLRVGDE